MYVPSREFANMRFSDNVLITEYFPLSRKFQHGVVIPLYSNGAVSVMFKDLFKKYNYINNTCCTGIANQEPLLSFEEYSNELNSLINRMNTTHQGAVSFSTRNIHDMYDVYKSLHGKKYIAGLIAIVRNTIINPVQDAVPVPPEGIPITIGFETYAAFLKRTLPMINLDYYTVSNMYAEYIKNHQLPGGTQHEIPFLIDCPDQASLTRVVGEAGPNLTQTIILDVVAKGTMSDDVLSSYYEAMQARYGIRERIANALLLYHPTMIQQTLQGLRKDLGVISDREIVWSKSHTVESSDYTISTAELSIL